MFGSNYDLIIYDGCNSSTNNCTNLGGAYQNDTRLEGKTVFTGESHFAVKEIEVFSIRV
jgi:fructose-specific component phosphotransferase system IIB-like protein